MEINNLTDKQKDEIIIAYDYYFSIIDLMLSDMSNISLLDIIDVIDELSVEMDKIKNGECKNEMSTNKIDVKSN